MSVYCIFRQDLQDFQDFFCLSRRKAKTYIPLRGSSFGYKEEQRSDMNVQQQNHRPLLLSFPGESGMSISRFRPRPPRKFPACQELARQTGESVSGRWKPRKQ